MRLGLASSLFSSGQMESLTAICNTFLPSINISNDRIAQVTNAITRFSEDFSLPSSDPATASKITSLLHPDIHWYDHGFHICRVGHNAVLGLHKAFLHCNQPFTAEIKGIYPTQEGGVVEQVWKGVCKNDIVRPDGSLVMKGSGKSFATHVCLVMRIDDEGRITRIDEYDHR